MTPVQYTVPSKVIVDAFEALRDDQQQPGYWSHDEVEPVRGEIKDHYIADQVFRCVYCRRQIVSANKALWDAEHVISRSKAPRFMFVPRNLAVSCKDCNIAKREKEIRRNKDRKSFPEGSQHYLLVHPHYDNYDDHILWMGDICVPVSPKGAATLVICNLTRFTAELLGVDGILLNPSFYKQMGNLVTAKTKTEAEAQLAALKVYVEKIPQEDP